MDYLICLIIIFCSGYYYSVTSKGSNITVLLLMICIVLLFLKNRNLKIKKGRLYFFIFFECTIFISAFFSGNIGKGSIKQMLLMVCVLFITSTYSWQKFKESYVKCMEWVSILAIFGYIISRTSLINFFPIVENYNGVDYFSGVFFSVIREPYIGPIIRMHGILWEPGLLASYEILAIIFLEKNDRLKKQYYLAFGLFIVSILMSKSGAGLMLLPIVLLYKILAKRDRVNLIALKTIFFGMFIGILFISTPINNIVRENEWLNRYVFSKIENNENISNSTRRDAVLGDFMIAMDNLPFGVGIDNYSKSIEELSNRKNINSASTSTLTSYIAKFGILGVVVAIVWLIGIYRLGSSFSKNFSRFVIMFIFFCILSKEPHGNLLFMNCILLYSLGEFKPYLRGKNEFNK